MWLTWSPFSFVSLLVPVIFFVVVIRIIRSFFRSSHRNIESRMSDLRLPDRNTDFETIASYPSVRPPGREGEIFRLADEMKGRLTVSDIVLETDLSIREAEDVINGMVDGTHVRMEVEDNGLVLYEFPEIISRFESE